jgi:hypothetical protein
MERYVIDLSNEERLELEGIVKKGKGGAHRIRHAQILLHSDKSVEKRTVIQIAKLLHCHTETVCTVKKRFVEQGMVAALDRKPRNTPPDSRLFDGEAEARLIQLACSQPPEGRSRWTLQLLSDKVVALAIVPHCTANTIHEVLKKTNLNPTYRNVGSSRRSRMLTS